MRAAWCGAAGRQGSGTVRAAAWGCGVSEKTDAGRHGVRRRGEEDEAGVLKVQHGWLPPNFTGRPSSYRLRGSFGEFTGSLFFCVFTETIGKVYLAQLFLNGCYYTDM